MRLQENCLSNCRLTKITLWVILFWSVYWIAITWGLSQMFVTAAIRSEHWETFAMCLWSPGSEVYIAKAKWKRAERTGKPLKYRNCSEVCDESTSPTFETIKSGCLILEAASSCCPCTLWWECQITRARFVSTGIILLEKNQQTLLQAHEPYFTSEENEM